MKIKKNNQKHGNNEENKIPIIKANNKHIVFNFSYMTKHKKYSMDVIKRDNKIKALLLDKLFELSIDDKVTILNLSKKRGFEKLHISQLKHDIHCREFSDERVEYLKNKDDFWVFRLGQLGRVIGQFHDHIFYVMAIDTKFDLYNH